MQINKTIALIWLIMLTMCFASNTAIARNYPLTIAGIRVTDTNAANIRGQGITGSVNYNPTSRTLTLNNATISYSQHIIDADSTLFIRLVGQNALINIAGLGDALYAKGDTLVIEGPEGSSLNSVIFCSGINSFNGTHLIVRGGCTINAFGHYGITATGNRPRELFTIDKSFVNACGRTDYSIGGFAMMSFTNSTINQPLGAYYKTSIRRMVTSNDSIIKDTVKIFPLYPVRIGQTLVTPDNANDIVGPEIISGKVQYVDSIKTLILSHATIRFTSYLSGSASIWCDSNVRILVIDSNRIIRKSPYQTSNSLSSIYLNGPQSIIEGSAGSYLQIDSGTYSIYSKSLHIKGGINIRANGLIYSYPNYGQAAPSRLEIDSSKVFAFYYNRIPITGFANVLLNGTCIAYPPNSYFDSTAQSFRNIINSASVFYDSMIIEPCNSPFRIYPVTVAGNVFHSANLSQLTGNYISGNISYDPDNKTLTLDNALITPISSHHGIQCDSNITINLIGVNQIDVDNSSQKNGIMFGGDTSLIKGTPADELRINSRSSFSIYALHDLTVKGGCNIKIAGRGITGRNDYYNPTTFKVDSSYVKVNPVLYYSDHISNFNNMVLTNAYVYYPDDAFYETNQYWQIVDADTCPIYSDSIVIKPSNSHNSLQTAKNANILIFPNPTSNKIDIISNLPMSRLEVFDTYGRLLKTLTPNAKQAIVNVRELQNGVYTIKIKTEGGIITKRFVVRH